MTLRHNKVHTHDCENCETKDDRVDHIVREISLQGELSEDQRQSLFEIAEKCPVHRTLHSEVKVESSLQKS